MGVALHATTQLNHIKNLQSIDYQIANKCDMDGARPAAGGGGAVGLGCQGGISRLAGRRDARMRVATPPSFAKLARGVALWREEQEPVPPRAHLVLESRAVERGSTVYMSFNTALKLPRTDSG